MQFLLEGWKDQCPICHNYPQTVDVMGDELVILIPFNTGRWHSCRNTFNSSSCRVREHFGSRWLNSPDRSPTLTDWSNFKTEEIIYDIFVYIKMYIEILYFRNIPSLLCCLPRVWSEYEDSIVLPEWGPYKPLLVLSFWSPGRPTKSPFAAAAPVRSVSPPTLPVNIVN